MKLRIEGIGFWASGLPDWAAACAFVADGRLPEAVPRKPAPTLLAPNERRRAPDTVALALEVAQAACQAAGADPRGLPSVFTSTHGDLAITDYMCATLADDPRAISPTRFHNSVHNAAAGYWTIGVGCMQPATALSAYQASFAQGLLEAAAQLADGAERVLVVAYDAESSGPLAPVSRSRDLLGAALVLAADDSASSGRSLQLALAAGAVPVCGDDALSQRYAGNAMVAMLPLFSRLAGDDTGTVALHAGHGRRLCVELGR
jgi:hypothetical protein